MIEAEAQLLVRAVAAIENIESLVQTLERIAFALEAIGEAIRDR